MSHPHNQDSLAIAAGTDARGRCAAVVAVSDGVSTSDRSAEAATIAARQAADCLADVLQAASIAPSEVSRHMRNAFRRANQAVLDAARDDLPGSWACTLVVASWWRGRLVVGNVGDSRCYWFPDDGPARLLSTDDSLAQARIELGVARRVAESGAQAHAILKWIGPGAGPCDPTMQTLSPRQDGWLVVCSDGLWNYASAADELGAVVASCLAELDEPRPPAWMLANRLTAWANAQGGHDNVSVGAVRVVVPRRA
ncbi:MAG: protein phosphatase 2C domain-containing protein [Propionibacteriaceae bacterium]|nr:protein phosphatase 2C domain-containing protein [Propionibacteriaceae bacterium]